MGGADGTATVTATGGTGAYSFLWSDGQTGPTATDLAANVYTCTVMDVNGCIDMLVVNINQPTEILISFDITHESTPGANDGSITATVTGGTMPHTLNWSNGGSGATISDLMPGDYTLTVLDGNDCVATLTGTVMGSGCDLTVDMVIVQDLLCPTDNDGILTVLANNALTSIIWSNGSTADSIFDLTSDNYSVTVTDAANCEAFAAVFLDGNDMEAPGYLLDTICLFLGADGTATLDSATFFANLEDNCDPNPTALFNELTVGCSDQGITSMDFSLRDASGNIAPTTLYLIIIDTLAPTITCPADITINTCDTVVYSLPTGDDNCGGVTITLAGGIGSGNIFPVGTTTETYEARDANGNLAACSFSVTVVSDLDISILTTDASCFDSDDGSAVITGIGGTAPYTFMVSPSDDILMLEQGTYQVTLTDNANCSSLDTFVIEGPNAIVLDSLIISDASAGNFDGSIEITVSGGTAPFDFLWRRDTAEYSTEEDLFNLFSDYYSVLITDANDCTMFFDSILVDEMVPNTNLENLDGKFKIFEQNAVIQIQTVDYSDVYQVELYDVTGRRIQQLVEVLGDTEIDMSDRSHGFYIVNLKVSGSNTISKGLIVH